MTDHENTEPQAGPDPEADDAVGARPAGSSPAPQAPVAIGVTPVGDDPQSGDGEPAEGGVVPANAGTEAPPEAVAPEIGAGEVEEPDDQAAAAPNEGETPNPEAVESTGTEDQPQADLTAVKTDGPAEPVEIEGQAVPEAAPAATAPEAGAGVVEKLDDQAAATPTESETSEPGADEVTGTQDQPPADSSETQADGPAESTQSAGQSVAAPEGAEPTGAAPSVSGDAMDPSDGAPEPVGLPASQPDAGQPIEASSGPETPELPAPGEDAPPTAAPAVQREPGTVVMAAIPDQIATPAAAPDQEPVAGLMAEPVIEVKAEPEAAEQPQIEAPPETSEPTEQAEDAQPVAAPVEQREPGTVVLAAIPDQIATPTAPTAAPVTEPVAEPTVEAKAEPEAVDQPQVEVSKPAEEAPGAAIEPDQPLDPDTAILPAVTGQSAQPAEPVTEATEAIVAAEALTTVLPPAGGPEPDQEPAKPTEPVPGAPQRVSVRPKRKSAKDKTAGATLARSEAATPAAGAAAAEPAKPPSALAMFDTPPKGPADPRRKRRRRRLVASLIVVALLVVAVGGVLGANLYFTNLAKPGVRLAGQDVSGKDADQIEQTAARLAKSYSLEITDGQTTVTATATQLGVQIDPAESAAQVMAATDELPFWEALNPWQAKDIPLVATVDQAKLQQFLDQSFIDPEEEAVDAKVELSEDGQSFVAVAGKIGLLVDPAPVLETIDQALAAGATGALRITPEQRPPDIPDHAAEQAALLANQALDIDITFTATDWRALLAELKLERGAIASWTRFDANLEDHTITVGYDQAAIDTDVAQTLADKMAVPARPQLVVTRPDNGEDIGVTQWGLDGLKVADHAAITQQVVDALDQGVDATIPVELTDDAFVTERNEAPSDFDVPNGSPWVDVNLSTFRATTYRGTTPVNSYIISTGASGIGRGTPTGTFYVYIKYEFQVMRGPESDPYEAPTNWVSYFTGGVAFHSAPWNEPNRWGMEVSHGCVNMQTWAAREMYDFAPIGTKVEVHR